MGLCRLWLWVLGFFWNLDVSVDEVVTEKYV